MDELKSHMNALKGSFLYTFMWLALPFVVGFCLPLRWWPHNIWRVLSAPLFFCEMLPSTGLVAKTNKMLLFLGPEDVSFGFYEVNRWCMGLYYLALSPLLRPVRIPDYYKHSEKQPNPDIVGTGVRVSMYIILLTTFASLFVGTFHSDPSGTKELGIATLINLLSLTINLFKARIEDLTPTDVFVLMVMADTHCVTLSATLSSKDALASRYYVWIAIAVQALAWAAVLHTDISVAALASNKKCTDSLDCMADRWMGIMINPGEQELTFRVYWIIHSYDLIQSSVLAACHTKRFDELEKLDREPPDLTVCQDKTEIVYSRLPSTAFSNWAGFVLYPIMLIVAVEGHLSGNRVDVGEFYEWGQSFAIITCACGVLHWLYVSIPLLKYPLQRIWSGSWTAPKDPMHPTNAPRSLAIGAL